MQKPLPKGWKMVRLAEVCSINPPKPVLKDDEEVTFLPMSAISDNGTVINRQIRLYGKVKKGYTGFIENDILFAKITPCMENGKGVIAKDLVNAVGFGSTEFHVVRASQDILPEIIFRYLSLDRIRKYAKNNMVGSAGQKRVPDIFLKSLQLPLPPRPAQHKIVEILEEADNLRKLRQQADEKMKDLIPSLFVQMFGDPATNPKGWKVIELRKTSTFKRGPFGGSLKKEIFVKNGYKVYEQKNAIYNDFEIGNYFVDEDKYHEMIAFAIQPDDLIISCSGTMGKVAIVPRSAKQGIINQALLKITPLKNMAIPLYLKFLFESRSLQNKYFSNAAGSAIQNVTSVDSLKRIKVPLPHLPLQQEFAKLVEEVESEKARQTESRKKLDELFNSLMQRAFTGELVA